jgi:hypothetical protein
MNEIECGGDLLSRGEEPVSCSHQQKLSVFQATYSKPDATDRKVTRRSRGRARNQDIIGQITFSDTSSPTIS